MSKKIVIDSTHNEETRVALIDNEGRLEDYDIESTARKLLKGNIFLAKVTRVEPSLQAAFVDYGGNRHGFLPFSEIHPDYYRIPIADKEAIMREEAELRRKLEEAAEAEEDGELDPEKAAQLVEEMTRDDEIGGKTAQKGGRSKKNTKKTDAATDTTSDQSDDEGNNGNQVAEEDDVNGNVKADDDQDETNGNVADSNDDDGDDSQGNKKGGRGRFRGRGRGRRGGRGGRGNRHAAAGNRSKEVRDDDDFTNPMQPLWNKIRRNYKIQEVIKRGQIMLIQINKEERGNKGAAVTSYITLPGRYCVLMPNSAQGGGVSRKINDRKERRRMRDVLKSLEVPEGMSVILRTAGLTRTKAEIKRDYSYLTRLWNSIRELTLKSSAPALIHEEGNLIHKMIRDVYSKEYEEITVAGEQGYKEARNFMKMMMPSHVKRVQHYEGDVPVFINYNVEKQIEDVNETTVQLKSGGYLVINPTEALVSIDVNSGRATRERHIEETALKTNLEAAEEVARQMRLRDLAGLVVIDFIDMENRKNNRQVERAIQKALSKDRAKVQCGQISNFGLMELSRQRLRPSMTEKNFIECPHCHGKGIVRTVDGAALTILRAIENEGVQGVTGKVTVEAPSDVLLFLLNHKRGELSALEKRYDMSIVFDMDDEMGASDYNLDAQRPKGGGKQGGKAAHKKDNAQKDKKDSAPKQDEQAQDEGEDKSQKQASSDKGKKAKDDQPAEKKAKSSGRGRKKQDDKQPQDQQAKKQGQDKAADNEAKEKADESSKPKRGRKPADKKQDQASDEAAADQKPKKQQGRKKTSDEPAGLNASNENENADPQSDESSAEKPKRGRKAAAAKKENDDKDKVVALEQREAQSSEAEDAKEPDYNVISESDGKKKKGWWSRMLEK